MTENNGKGMRKAKSIDQLYDEVRDCSLVITNDAALATALNKMIDRPMIGPFAMTPQQIASATAIETLGKPTWNELKVAMTVAEETGLDFRYVHSQIQFIQEVHRYNMDVRKFMYTDDARAVYDSYRAIPTLEKAMEEFDKESNTFYHRDGDIAVIGDYIESGDDDRYGNLPIFNHLEKNFIPPGEKCRYVSIYDGIDARHSEFIEYRIPKIYRIGNDRQLAECAVALIDRNRATDYAIVLKSDSHLADAVRAALYRNGNIPFVNSLSVKDLNQIRDFVEFVNISLSFDTLRIGDIRELFSSLGFIIPRGINEHLVNKEVFRGDAETYRQLMRDINDYTFEYIRKRIFEKRRSDGGAVKILLEDLDIADRKVAPELLAKITYAVDNVKDLHHNEQIPDTEKRGVLIADCNNSMYIDRPVVIYLGMEQDWNVDFSDKRYVDDADYETMRAAVRLEVLLQQGQQRFYLINSSKKGEEPKPCLLFDRIFGKSVKSFDDICDSISRDSWASDETPIPMREKDNIGEVKPIDYRLSQSALREYAKCPYTFMFNSLVTTEDKDYFEFGNIIHEFAEMYVSHKDIVDEKGIDFYIDLACRRFSGISTPMKDGLDRQRIDRTLRRVKRFIDTIGIENVPLDKEPDKDHPNFFFTCVEPNIDITTSLCENDIPSKEHSLHGKMDLNVNGVAYDYKSGGGKTTRQIGKAMDFEKISKDPDFQALMYLTITSELGMGDEFDLFFATDNETEADEENFDVRRNVRRVKIVDMTDDEFFRCDVVSQYFNSGKSKSKYQTNDVLRPQFIAMVLNSVQGPKDTWLSQKGIIGQAIHAAIGKSNGVKDESTTVNAVEKYLRCILGGYAAGNDTLYVRREYLNRFTEFFDGVYAQIQEQSVNGFPVAPRIECEKCNFREFCTFEKESVEDDKEMSE